MIPAQRHYLFATGTRADWGLLSPLAKELKRYGYKVTVAATNMHLMKQYGNTISEIELDGFNPIIIPASGTPAEISSDVMRGFSKHLENSKYDAIIILGDRYEMLAVAQAAVLCGVPIIHIAGGAVSYGAYDDCFRHAITKLASLHLVETEHYRQRVIQMGELPERVITTGAIGIYDPNNEVPLMTREMVEESLGFSIPNGTLLVTLHSATRATIPPSEQLDNLFRALNEFPDRHVLFTYPNNDSDGEIMIRNIETYVRLNSHRAHAIASLGHLRYLSTLQLVDAVVGNSSSGLVEVPSMGIPTLDIGCRQDGRTRGQSVVHCGESTSEIINGLRQVLSPQMQEIASRCENPYYQKDTISKMREAIVYNTFSHYPVKKFHDI